MRIFVDEIDSESTVPIGFAKLPSFLVHFRSAFFSGVARLVPGSGQPEGCEGRAFEVEMGQDSITEFRITEQTSGIGIEALATEGSFKVQGVVRSIVTPTEPVGCWYTHVAAGDAVFTLDQNDVGGINMKVGTPVSFIVQNLSFWDEAI